SPTWHPACDRKRLRRPGNRRFDRPGHSAAVPADLRWRGGNIYAWILNVMISRNHIVDEAHRIREQMLAEYGGDLRALMRDSQRRTEEAAKAGRVVVRRAPRK